MDLPSWVNYQVGSEPRKLKMSIQLSQQDFQRLIQIVQNLPEWGGVRDRRNLLMYTLQGNNQSNTILARLDLDGSPMITATQTVKLLGDFGQITSGNEALGVFIDQLLKNVLGHNADADFMAEIVEKYHLIATLQPQPSNVVPLEDIEPVDSNQYIFISYARPDQVIAEQVEKYLVASGIRTFRDVNDIRSSDNWDLTIEKALTETDRMILILSGASMPYRKEVYREWFAFDQKRKPIHPLYVQECTLHTRFAPINYIDARSDLSSALKKLVEDILHFS